MNSVCRALSQSTRTGSYPIRFLLQTSYATSSSTTAKPSKRSNQKSPPLPLPSSSDWPRPREIPFQAKVSNSVNLIGYVSEPIQYLASPDGKHWAATVITHHDYSSHSHSPPLWIPIIFEGDLAHVAACHLKKKDHVYIAGQLTADPPPIDVIQGQAQVRIMVHDINFVQVSSQLTKSHWRQQQEGGFLPEQKSEQGFLSEQKPEQGFLSEQKPEQGFLSEQKPEQQEVSLKDCGSMKKDGDSALNSWKDLLDNPKQWWDYRSSKTNPKHPDFKRKDGALALWLSKGLPWWILSKLEKTEFDVQVPSSRQVKKNKGEESWKNLVENPDKWWDNRSNKRNVKSPDFKHKETGEALWLNDSPTWVPSKLPPLKGEQNVAGWGRQTLLS